MIEAKPIGDIAKPIFTVEVYILHKDEILMQKRSMSMKKFPGWWTIPGGHIDENEDPLAAAIREVNEETGITITPKDIKLKYVSMHNHLDRKEMYVPFAFEANLPEKVAPVEDHEEGKSIWVKKSDALNMQNVFPPIKYYFDHVLNNHPGIIYNMSDWEKAELVKVHSQTVDMNG